jgi:hypothetical protein
MIFRCVWIPLEELDKIFAKCHVSVNSNQKVYVGQYKKLSN